MTVYLGLFFAFACAITTNLSFLYKYRGCSQSPTVRISHPLRTARHLFANRWFALGMGISAIAFALHVAAIGCAPLSLVQTTTSCGLVFVAVFAQRWFGVRVGVRQWAGVAMTAVGMAAMALTLPAVHGAHSRYSLTGMLAFEGVLAVVGAFLAWTGRETSEHRAQILATLTGLLFGSSDVAIKALSGLSGPTAVITSPWLAMALCCGVLAFFVGARSYQRGDAVGVITLTSLTASLVGVSGGLVVFGDPLPHSPVALAVHMGSFAVVLAAALLVPAAVAAPGAAATA